MCLTLNGKDSAKNIFCRRRGIKFLGPGIGAPRTRGDPRRFLSNPSRQLQTHKPRDMLWVWLFVRREGFEPPKAEAAASTARCN